MRLFLVIFNHCICCSFDDNRKKVALAAKKTKEKFLLAKLLKQKMASFLETTRIRGLNGQEDKVSLTFFSFPDFEDYFEWKNKIFLSFFENVTFFVDFYPL